MALRADMRGSVQLRWVEIELPSRAKQLQGKVQGITKASSLFLQGMTQPRLGLVRRLGQR